MSDGRTAPLKRSKGFEGDISAARMLDIFFLNYSKLRKLFFIYGTFINNVLRESKNYYYLFSYSFVSEAISNKFVIIL